MTFRCRLDWLRHGESELSSVLRGSTDDALTVKGWAQMQHSIDMVLQTDAVLPWQVIYSSPLQRCAHFAQDLAQQHQLELIQDPGLQEMHFGAWEGQSTADLYAKYPEQLAQFWQTPSQFSPPQAETLQLFQRRVINAVKMILRQMSRQGQQHALVVSHAGVIKLLKTLALGQDVDRLLSQSAELGQLHRFDIEVDLEVDFGGGLKDGLKDDVAVNQMINDPLRFSLHYVDGSQQPEHPSLAAHGNDAC